MTITQANPAGTPSTRGTGIKERIPALLESVLTDSKIPAVYRPVIKNMVVNFLGNTDENEIAELVRNFRDEIIPWLLGELDD